MATKGKEGRMEVDVEREGKDGGGHGEGRKKGGEIGEGEGERRDEIIKRVVANIVCNCLDVVGFDSLKIVICLCVPSLPSTFLSLLFIL